MKGASDEALFFYIMMVPGKGHAMVWPYKLDMIKMQGAVEKVQIH